MTDLQAFERQLARDLQAFQEPEEAKRPTPKPATSPVKGLTVRLAVRRKRLSLDEVFCHEVDTISRLDARLRAEKAARKAGWPIIGHVIDYQRLEG